MLDITKFDKFFIANWKLNGTLSFVQEYLSKITSNYSESKCVVICPPFVFINQIKLKGLFIGAQNCSIYSEGAFTGEISTKILNNLGCMFCIIGHSERRNFFLEDNKIINEKISQCLNENIIPILCVGENLEQKNNNLTKEVLKEQLEISLPKEANYSNVIIAYEPLWAIGSGVIPRFEDISKIHVFIKNDIKRTKNFKTLYGGSVNQSNCNDILKERGVDGLLIGGASLKIEEFNKIIES